MLLLRNADAANVYTSRLHMCVQRIKTPVMESVTLYEKYFLIFF